METMGGVVADTFKNNPVIRGGVSADIIIMSTAPDRERCKAQ